MTFDSVRMLTTLLAIGAGAWVGGLVTVILVVVSSKAMNPLDRVTVFRRFGRGFAVFFGIAAVFVVAPSVVLSANVGDALSLSITVLAIGLLLATAGGVLQARRMTALRTAFDSGIVSAATVQHNAGIAAVIRAILVVGYVVLLVLAVLIAVTLK